MDFNVKSRLNEVLQVSQRVERDEQGRISVFMGSLNAKTDIRVPLSISKAVNKYRVRFSLIGFNFRQEYYEYLEVKDVELRKHGQLEAQEIRFETQPEADQLLMLSVSLLAYSETRMEEGYVLLNSKEFSPCALIAAYAAEEPGYKFLELRKDAIRPLKTTTSDKLPKFTKAVISPFHSTHVSLAICCRQAVIGSTFQGGQKKHQSLHTRS